MTESYNHSRLKITPIRVVFFNFHKVFSNFLAQLYHNVVEYVIILFWFKSWSSCRAKSLGSVSYLYFVRNHRRVNFLEEPK